MTLPTIEQYQQLNSETLLTIEEASFLHNFYLQDVPVGEIASMMEVMRADRLGSAVGNLHNYAQTNDGGSGASGVLPPAYDFKSG